ncbi:hypothetical protein TSACC_2724 [Terrimicrobium sacchariphilum]|uniref:Uncharacterized protein n=1 Tax=Terrimicrobium sacchariphilum TaxID=690879 RepID=A0A146G6J5_TERSA|nr:hypothetical protein [Terrimicrobium sacchariphilum]GAT32326.1 hypothetical protein TSACC_2724 [Terrimicrobium sacchariphilum]
MGNHHEAPVPRRCNEPAGLAAELAIIDLQFEIRHRLDLSAFLTGIDLADVFQAALRH